MIILSRLPKILSTFSLMAGICLAEGDAYQAAEIEFRQKIEPLLQDYCYDCHGDGASKGDFVLDDFTSTAALLENQHVWLRIWENLRTQIMPPAKEEFQPSVKERKEMIAWIEQRIFSLDPENPDPGRVTIRRMNRQEYRNTIADVVGVNFNTADNFPPDDTGFGFDTIGDVLTISPLLMEKYFNAAEEIAEAALPIDAGKPKPIMIDAGDFRDRGGRQTARFMEANAAQTVTAKRIIDTSAQYSLEVAYTVKSEGGQPKGQSAKFQMLIDGKKVLEIDFNSDTSRGSRFLQNFDLVEGDHRFEFVVIPRENGEGSGTSGIQIDRFQLRRLGSDGNWNLYPESFQRIFIDGLPTAGEKEQATYMRKIVENFAFRAFRRPPRKKLIDQITNLALSKSKEGKFSDGVRLAVTATLSSPSFLFRRETQVEPDNPGKVVLLDEYALASRLSYFLWTSAPDKILLDLVAKNQLRKNLRAQVDRMLADKRSDRMVKNFVGQWLQTRDLQGLHVDTRRILKERDRRKANRVFNLGTRRDMKQETEEFFRYVLLKNRPILELLNGNYSFLNENLANFYGVSGVKGDEFRKVEFNEQIRGRGGILGQGTFLIVTSQSTRTSPVKRGLFVLDNILGTPAPPAPPDVPDLEEVAEHQDAPLTMRQIMEVHREKPLCSSCHERMDPIGLALENFNALGQWRDKQDGKEIDSAGKLVTGETFSNIMELKTILAGSRKQDFYRCLSEKLLTYALGRGVEYYDAPTIDTIMAQLLKDSGGMKDLIYAIIESVPFQKRRGDGKAF